MRTGPFLEAACSDLERFSVHCYLAVQVLNAKCEAFLIFNKYVEIKIRSAFWSNNVHLIQMQEIEMMPADLAGPQCYCKRCKTNLEAEDIWNFALQNLFLAYMLDMPFFTYLQ